MDEIIDILDSDGNTTGKTSLKSVAHQKGLFHATVHIWFYTTDKQILLQKRSANKNTFPNLWDISVAGHIAAGEKIENAAIREIEEEIGLRIHKNELQKIGVKKSTVKHKNGIIDNQFHHIFIVKLTCKLTELKKQKEEVAELQLVDLFLLKNPKQIKNLVPRHQSYYSFVYNNIAANL